jgi:recombination associated protein RdgC
VFVDVIAWPVAGTPLQCGLFRRVIASLRLPMWFKNLQIYRLTAPWTHSAKALDDQLSRHAFRNCSAYELQTFGWASPREDGALVYAVNGHTLIKLGHEKKLLPAAVIKETVREKAQALEGVQGFKPGRKQMRELKDQVTDELLPRAFNVRRNMWVWIDAKHQRLVIDAGSPAKADEVIGMLNKSINDLALERLNVALSPTVAMTTWLGANEPPHGFTIDQETELQSPLDEKATVRFVRHTLEPADVSRHIKAGKQCTRLALTWANRVSFVLTESLTIKKVAPMDLVKEGGESAPQNDDERFDADTVMMTGEIGQLLSDLIDALGGEADAA